MFLKDPSNFLQADFKRLYRYLTRVSNPQKDAYYDTFSIVSFFSEHI